MDKLVSVNITTYNRFNLLPRCLDGILNQSYKNLEIIIVDDCSNDNTTELVRGYQAKDSRIKYFRHETNKGNSHSRNTALENCTGYYVAFMDDDDEWIDDNKIKKQVEIFENTENERLGIVCSSVRLFSDKNSYKDKVIQKPCDLTGMILKSNGYIYSPTVMTKRNLMIEVGGFDINLPRGVDSDFYRNCIVKYGYDVYFMEGFTTGVHEYGDDRMTLQNTKKSLTDAINVNIYLLKKYFRYYLVNLDPAMERVKKILVAKIALRRMK
jgi:teichuronic acid biosynthesis glycosyltransferase TuaG